MFGEYLRRIREERGFGLREASKKFNVSPAYLSQIERGESKPPSEEVLVRISDVLKVDECDIFFQAGKIPSAVENKILGDFELFKKLKEKM